MRARLSGAQWRIIGWVVRQTYGWNRRYTPFTWYRMAQELGMNRPALYRASRALLNAGVLAVHQGQVTIDADPGVWSGRLLSPMTGACRQLWLPAVNVVGKQRRALPQDNVNVAGAQPNRCQEATLFRLAKEVSKDRLKKYKKTDAATGGARQSIRNSILSERQHLARAATPIPGKYDGLSQN